MEKRGRSAMVVDHDIYFIDMVSDSIMVFSGIPGMGGHGRGPFDMRAGMNLFLKEINITFRRDNETNRPRINKLGSRLDREQKGKGEYYYSS
jgi:ATP-binding cassette subfamily E protein 1